MELTNKAGSPIVALPHSNANPVLIRADSSRTVGYIYDECFRIIIDDEILKFQSVFPPDEYVEFNLSSTTLYGRFTDSHRIELYKKDDGPAAEEVFSLPEGCE